MGTTLNNNPTNPYWIVFCENGANEPKRKRIETATAMLLEAMDKPENPKLQEQWAKQLAIFPGDQLAAAFFAATLSADGFPRLRTITDFIFASEFAADYAWLLDALRRHGADWRDVEASYHPRKRIPGGTPEDLYPAELAHPSIPAPTIPERLVRAVRIFSGCLDRRDGLAALQKHPACRAYQWDAGEEQRIRALIDREFRAAWMTARMEAIVGG